MIETAVVGMIVAAAAIYTTVKLLPAAIVSGWQVRIARQARRAGVPRVARMLEARAGDAGCGTGCATCGTCAQNPPPAPAAHRVDASRLKRGEHTRP